MQPSQATAINPSGIHRDLRFFLNGSEVVIPDPDPTLLLVDYLRSDEVGLTGTKKVCAQGGCGACTVMVSQYDSIRQTVEHRAINACLCPVCALDGMAVTTTEGTGSTKTQLSPVQFRIANENGTQCGYCTPGWVMNMHAFLAANQGRKTDRKEIEALFDGNLCRCTGYRPILYAMQHFASDWNREDERHCMKCDVDPLERVPHQKSVHPFFPPELRRVPRALQYSKNGREWFRPLHLKDLFRLRRQHPDGRVVKLVCGNTSLGIDSQEREQFRVWVDIAHLSELQRFAISDGRLTVGSGTRYSQLIRDLEEAIGRLPEEQTAGLRALHYLAGRTAGHIVRNAASLAGNTMLVARHAMQGAPFPSDLFTVWCALGATLLIGAGRWPQPRRMPIREFVTRYAKDPVLRNEAVILAYEIPLSAKGECVRAYKVARRHDNAHTLLNAAFRVQLDSTGGVKSAALVFGGLAPVAFHATQAERWLVGKKWDGSTLREALTRIEADVNREFAKFEPRWRTLPWDGIGPSYLKKLAVSFFYKFFIDVALKAAPENVPADDACAAWPDEWKVSRGTQKYEVYPEEYPVSKPMIKLAAFRQATGEAQYTQDLPAPRGGLHGAFVTSTRALAQFNFQTPQKRGSRRTTAAGVLAFVKKRFPGVVGFLTAKDVRKGANLQGLGNDDPLFSDKEVTCFGQSIGLVVAESEPAALAAANFIREQCIAYRDKKDARGRRVEPILTIEQAVEAGSFLVNNPPSAPDMALIPPVCRPGSQLNWVNAPHGEAIVDGEHCRVLRGQQYTDGQIHFYLETHTCLAIPQENKAMLVYSATQNPGSIQTWVARTLGIPNNSVDVIVKQLGGGYGGKDPRSAFVAGATALAAWKLGRPVRTALPREEDTNMIGHRHPFLGNYAIAVVDRGPHLGRILGLNTELLADGGNTYDCSLVVMSFAMLNADMAYRVRNFYVNGRVCRTNKTSATAMRAFGYIQAALIQEDAIEAAAQSLGIVPEDLREKNLYEVGDALPYGPEPGRLQRLGDCYLKDVWKYERKRCDFDRRFEAVQEFNRRNRWRKRGICLMPLKYGLGYNLGLLEQAGALIDVYADDGTVLVQHGGVEMGQGLVTKVAQVAALALGLPLELIRVGESNGYVVPNPVSTGASSGSNVNCGAVNKAGLELRRRLENFCAQLLKRHGSVWCQKQGINFWDYSAGWKQQVTLDGKRTRIWNQIVSLAFSHRIDLSSQALFRTRGLDDLSEEQFYGFSYSAACSEVEIDVLTGETVILRTDIAYDMGKSMNPAIDVGQVEGGFIMGVGNVLCEELVWQPTGESRGALNTLNTWQYKIPSSRTIPRELHVDLFPREKAAKVPLNPNLVLSSKAVGEPPLVLAATVFFAVKRAILAARQDRGLKDWFELKSPATVERVRMACAVEAEDLQLKS
ncbi:MAG: molybdopterin cofactor-binding domain-containing protein [Verrucomicrobiota bacterium]